MCQSVLAHICGLRGLLQNLLTLTLCLIVALTKPVHSMRVNPAHMMMSVSEIIEA